MCAREAALAILSALWNFWIHVFIEQIVTECLPVLGAGDTIAQPFR